MFLESIAMWFLLEYKKSKRSRDQSTFPTSLNRLFHGCRAQSTSDELPVKKTFWQRLRAKRERTPSYEKTSLRSLVTTDCILQQKLFLIVLVSIRYMDRFDLSLSGNDCIGRSWPNHSILYDHLR